QELVEQESSLLGPTQPANYLKSKENLVKNSRVKSSHRSSSKSKSKNQSDIHGSTRKPSVVVTQNSNITDGTATRKLRNGVRSPYIPFMIACPTALGPSSL